VIQKINLSQIQKSELEKFSNSKIYLQVSFGDNNPKILELAKLGLDNSAQYLERHKLGQRLNIMEENSLYRAVISLQKLLGLKITPRRIECYDISHLSGTHVYGSMVTCIDGRMIKKFYKLFKVKEQNNDYNNHAEVMTRRLQKAVDYPDKIEWQLPDLMIIDGGKGQLSSDYLVLTSFNLQDKKSF
jgi:excinuclease ABC subunit C